MEDEYVECAKCKLIVHRNEALLNLSTNSWYCIDCFRILIRERIREIEKLKIEKNN